MYIAFDVAPEEVVWYCKIRQAAWARDIHKKRSESAWKHWPENLREKSVLCEQLLWILLCMVTAWSCCVVGKLVLNLNSVRCFWYTWSSHLPDLALLGYLLWGYMKSKVYRTYPANTDDLKQGICSVLKGSPQKCYNISLVQELNSQCSLRNSRFKSRDLIFFMQTFIHRIRKTRKKS